MRKTTSLPFHVELTPRQEEVLKLTASGLTAREIAKELGTSEKTVEAHKAALSAKLGKPTKVEMAAWAYVHGLVDPEDVAAGMPRLAKEEAA